MEGGLRGRFATSPHLISQFNQESTVFQFHSPMAKKVVAMIKLALQAGKANPAPPVGPALGQHGVNIMAFCKEYNARTQDKAGFVIPVEISVFEDRSFTFRKTELVPSLEIASIKVPF